jgi:hypothetical protein
MKACEGLVCDWEPSAWLLPVVRFEELANLSNVMLSALPQMIGVLRTVSRLLIAVLAISVIMLLVQSRPARLEDLPAREVKAFHPPFAVILHCFLIESPTTYWWGKLSASDYYLLLFGPVSIWTPGERKSLLGVSSNAAWCTAQSFLLVASIQTLLR